MNKLISKISFKITLRYSYLLLVFTLVAPLVISPKYAAAQNSIYKTLQTPFYDSGGVATNDCLGSEILIGSDNVEASFNYFRDKGLSSVQAAGFVGNLMQESGVDPKSVNPSSGATGIAQWLGGRLDGLKRFATLKKTAVDDLKLQLDYIWLELNYSERAAYEDLKSQTTLEGATLSIREKYERPGLAEANDAQRLAFALDTLTKYGSNDGSASDSDSAVCATNTSATVVGNLSLPVAKKWYNQNPEWFTKPHAGYAASDIPVPTGTPVFSMTDGKITKITNEPDGCGKGVMIDAGGGITFIYCHGLDAGSISGAKEGSVVKAGQQIMNSGNSGKSTGPHLHVQIKVGEQNRCPQSLFVGIANGKVPDIKSLPAKGCIEQETT